MFPTLKINKELSRKNGFINAYIDDNNKLDKYLYSIYVLFKPINNDDFKEFLDKEYENQLGIIEDYNINDYVVIVYKLDDNFINDFNLIKESKYSKTSKQFKNLFKKEIEIVDEIGNVEICKTLQHKIFDKDESLINYWNNELKLNLKKVVGKDYEVWFGFNIEKETLNINQLIKQE